ncbi:hypothetical protein GCM10009827_097570 [Dactylosporangium maewongense]|uniref:CHAT domain-containing protein n=1 Tax=Dactylosporangium maewongense TaxID=634393 RepID=A0ABP4NI58_9ACTN
MTRPRLEALDITLSVTAAEVRLSGAGVDFRAPHDGVRPGLGHAIHDARRERTRSGGRPSGRDLAAAPAPDLLSLRRAGVLLAESFLPGPLAAALTDLVRRTVRETIALRLAVDAPGFAWLPWEALPDPETRQPLALLPRISVYRSIGGTAQFPSAGLAGPLRIVVAIASPDINGGPLLDYEHELRAVTEAVHKARRSGARVEVVQFATTAAIRAALDVSGGVHVLHISAHGRPGVLLLEDDDGKARPVTADELIQEAVPSGRMPPVISLAACYTDTGGEQDGSSYAAHLAARGASAVIGTQTSVTDRYATLLFARIYAELAAIPDADVVRAVTDARRLVHHDLTTAEDPLTIQVAGLDEWGVVTLLAAGPRIAVVDHTLPHVPAPQVRATTWGGVAARPPGRFVGRRRLQRSLPAALDGDTYAGLVLHGIGGIGKTALAGEVLRRIVDRDPACRVATVSGQVTVDGVLAATATAARRELLRRQTVPGPQTAAVQAADRMDLSWQDRFALLREDVLDDIPIVIVLDNFEDNLTPAGDRWVVTDPALADLLTAWLADAGLSRLLITSRHPVHVTAAVNRRLLEQPVGPLTAAETAKLLWSLPNVDRHAPTTAAAGDVWRLVGGHPRSLEYLDALLGQGQARFDDVTDRLTAAVTARLGPTRTALWLAQDRTLADALADTITLTADDVLLTDHLTRLGQIPGALETLAAVSVHRQSVPTVALAFHTGVPDPAASPAARVAVTTRMSALLGTYELMPADLAAALDPAGPLAPRDRAELEDLVNAHRRPPYTAPDDLADLLVVLRNSSLIHHDQDTGTVFMHRWTATELHRRWQTPRTTHLVGEVTRAHRSAAEYRQWRAETGPQDPVADLLDREEACHHLIAAGDLDAANVLTEHICLRLHRWGAWDREAALIHDTLRRLPPGHPRRPAWTHQLGLLAQHRGDLDGAERSYQEALTAFEQLGDDRGAGTCTHQLGVLAHLRGDLAEAELHYERAMAGNERRGDEVGVAISHGQLGSLAFDRGDLVEAERRYRLALTINERLGNEPGVAAGRHQLGILAQQRGDLVEAERQYLLALGLRERLGDQLGTVSTEHQLGQLAQLRGDHAEATRRCQRALSISERLGDQAGIAVGNHQLGILAHDRGDHAEAERRYRLALDIHERLGNQARLASGHGRLGILARQRGDNAEAERRYELSLAIDERLGNQAGIATAVGQLGDLRAEAGDGEAAVRLHLRAFTIRLSIGLPEAVRNLARLRQLRVGLGPAAFAVAARQVLDDAEYANLTAALETPPEPGT